MFLFSSHPAPLWPFPDSLWSSAVTWFDSLFDKSTFSTAASKNGFEFPRGVWGMCSSLHVFVGFVHIPKNMHVLRNIPAFATELELEDRNHVVASLHADTACTGLSHVTSYSVFVFASSWRAVQRHRLQLWVWIISLVIFFSFSSTFRVSLVRTTNPLQINLRWVDALIQSNSIDAQGEDAGKEEEAVNAEKWHKEMTAAGCHHH